MYPSVVGAVSLVILRLIGLNTHVELDWESVETFESFFLQVRVAASEELAWVSFMVNVLAARFRLFQASMFVGFAWGVWYIPLVLTKIQVAPGFPIVPLIINFMVPEARARRAPSAQLGSPPTQTASSGRAVEVTNSTHAEDFSWVERLNNNGQPVTSLPVTTTGPATLVAFWWGDGGADGEKVAVPSAGFQVLDSLGDQGSLVQCFVAAREVDTAGTYDVTWSATPPQGAQLWLIAVQ